MDPNLIRLVDADGVETWASRTTKHVVDGLADGSYAEWEDGQKKPKVAKAKPVDGEPAQVGEGAEGAAADASDGDGKDAGKSRH